MLYLCVVPVCVVQVKVQEKEAEQKAIQDELQALNKQVEELVPQKDETQKARDQKKKALKTAQVSLLESWVIKVSIPDGSGLVGFKYITINVYELEKDNAG